MSAGPGQDNRVSPACSAGWLPRQDRPLVCDLPTRTIVPRFLDVGVPLSLINVRGGAASSRTRQTTGAAETAAARRAPDSIANVSGKTVSILFSAPTPVGDKSADTDFPAG